MTLWRGYTYGYSAVAVVAAVLSWLHLVDRRYGWASYMAVVSGGCVVMAAKSHRWDREEAA